jgi:hypothetical protein
LLQNKKATLIVGAIVFLAVIFFLKNQSNYKNQASQDAVLAYGNLAVKDLVEKDTDLDGIQDWEEGLWGTDPTKKDTNDDGTPDNVEIARMKTERQLAGEDGQINLSPEEENLTQTDKFSRELFTTVAALNQTGQVDQNTVDTLTTSLVEKIKNPEIRKTFIISDILTTEDNSLAAFQQYNTAVNNLYTQNPINGNALDILQEFVGDGENININALTKLDPILNQTKSFIDGMLKIKVPSSIAPLHLDITNSLQRLVENLTDLQLFESDPVIAMSAMSKYEENTALLEASAKKMSDVITNKFGN